jgi:hypothetical protein
MAGTIPAMASRGSRAAPQGPGGQGQPVEERQVEPAEPVQRGDGRHQGGPAQVVGHHHPPQRPAVEHPAEQRPGHHRGQPGAEQDQADGRPGPGEVEHDQTRAMVVSWSPVRDSSMPADSRRTAGPPPVVPIDRSRMVASLAFTG